MCKLSSFNLQKNAVRFGSGLSHFSAHPSWVIPRWFRPYLQISILHFYRAYIWETSSNLGKLPWVWHGACFSGKNQAKFGIKLYVGIPAQISGLPRGCWCRMGTEAPGVWRQHASQSRDGCGWQEWMKAACWRASESCAHTFCEETKSPQLLGNCLFSLRVFRLSPCPTLGLAVTQEEITLNEVAREEGKRRRMETSICTSRCKWETLSLAHSRLKRSSGGAWNQPPQHKEHTQGSLQQAEQRGLKLRVGPAEAGSAALQRWLREAARWSLKSVSSCYLLSTIKQVFREAVIWHIST